MPHPRLLPATLLALITLAAAAGDHREARRLREAGEIVPLSRITDQVGGRVLDVELERRGGGYVYEVEFLGPRGQVRTRYYDAHSGRPLRGPGRE